MEEWDGKMGLKTQGTRRGGCWGVGHKVPSESTLEFPGKKEG